MRYLPLSIVLLLAFFSCRQGPGVPAGSPEPTGPQETLAAPAGPVDVIGLISPFWLSGVENTILLRDYFMDPARIDSVSVPPGLSAELSDTRDSLVVKITGDIGFLSDLPVWIEGEAHHLLLRYSPKRHITLRFPDRGYRSVAVKGEMNSWDPKATPCTKEDKMWVCRFEVRPGAYQYRFVADGREYPDPYNKEKVSNGQGGINSLLNLPQADPAALPKLRTAGSGDEYIDLSFENQGAAFAYWQNRRLVTEPAGSGFRLQVPEEAKTVKRSWVRVLGQNESGIGNDLLIPLEYGNPVDNPAQLTRHDHEAQIMYFFLIDRFHNGDPGNDDPVGDERLHRLANYLGGDLAGITAKIREGYLDSLHINALWLSPITQNPLEAYQEYPEPHRWYSGYHGYWPIRSGTVDHRFGNDEALQELVTSAHGKDMNVLLDYVCNHVHLNHPIYRQHPDWVTELNLPDGRKNIRLWDEQRLTTWFDTFIPTLDLENPEVIDVQTDSTLYWVKAFGLDGYRHDATKHIPQAFWRTLTRKLKEEVMAPDGRKLYQIGETYADRELIRSYIGSGMVDAQFDFNLYFDAREVFGKEDVSFAQLVNSLQQSFDHYGYHSSMGYISGNHDQVRFISLAGGAVAFEENGTEAGYGREVGVGDPVGYDRLQMLQAFNLTIPGVPVIYYGDEIGLPGAGDPDNRRMMRFTDLNDRERETLAVTRKLTGLRADRLSLTYGDTEILQYDEDTFVFLRTYFDERTVVAFNKSRQTANLTIRLPAYSEGETWRNNFGTAVDQTGRTINLTLPPVSFEILTD